MTAATAAMALKIRLCSTCRRTRRPGCFQHGDDLAVYGDDRALPDNADALALLW